jgi:FkbM family methyltransferase
MTELERLLSEPFESVRDRERHTLDRLLEECGRRVVLFGAGGLGRNAMACLRSIGIEPVAVTDNNASLWGTAPAGVGIVSPEDAARLHGGSALFLVAIWNPYHWFRETRDRLASLGCRRIVPPSPLYWRFPETFLPFYAQDFPHRVFEQAADVLRVGGMWSDARSRDEYLRQIRWRALGEWTFDRPAPEDADSYFLPRVFSLRADEVFVDCGAFDGDTLRAYLARQPEGFRRYIAVEPGEGPFQTLKEVIRALPAPLCDRVEPVRCVVGPRRERVRFDDTGDMGSKASTGGASTIESIPIAELAGESTPVTFIKMDIEGAEHDALLGARPAIERDAPILAICVYHSQDDLWRLPLLMKAMVPGYRMFLRCHEGDGWQTVAYAVPPDRVREAAS